jgi:M6 family metalloprotease-like protein
MHSPFAANTGRVPANGLFAALNRGAAGGDEPVEMPDVASTTRVRRRQPVSRAPMMDEAWLLLRLMGMQHGPLRWLARLGGVRFMVGAVLAAMSFAFLPTAQLLADESDLTAFGWRMKEAKGSRPLLVIWVRQPDDTPASEIERRKQYYEELFFGRPTHSQYPDALRTLEPSLVQYFRDASSGKFTWRRAGFVGPLSAPVNGKGPADIARLAIAAAAADGHIDFRAFDANHDGIISYEELAILVISNVPNGQTNHFRGKGFPVPGQNVTFAGGDSVIGEGGTFATTAHELFHTLGGIDLYGPWGGCYDMNRGLTLMAGTGGDHMPDSEWIASLDPWHKILVGWIEPRIIPIGMAGSAQLAAQHLAMSSEPVRKRPLLLYDPAKGKSEFFLLEYRTPYRLGYDQGVATSGLVIWHVLHAAGGMPTHLTSERPDCKGAFVQVVSMFVRGAPDWQQGASRAYTSANGDIALKWMDGRDSGVRVRVAPHKPSDPVIDISWTAGNTPSALAPVPHGPIGGRS